MSDISGNLLLPVSTYETFKTSAYLTYIKPLHQQGYENTKTSTTDVKVPSQCSRAIARESVSVARNRMGSSSVFRNSNMEILTGSSRASLTTRNQIFVCTMYSDIVLYHQCWLNTDWAYVSGCSGSRPDGYREVVLGWRERGKKTCEGHVMGR